MGLFQRACNQDSEAQPISSESDPLILVTALPLRSFVCLRARACISRLKTGHGHHGLSQNGSSIGPTAARCGYHAGLVLVTALSVISAPSQTQQYVLQIMVQANVTACCHECTHSSCHCCSRPITRRPRHQMHLQDQVPSPAVHSFALPR